MVQAITAGDVDIARRTAKKIVRRTGLSMSIDDAVGVAYLALVEAARSFDPSRNTTFSSHAFFRIRGALLDQSYKDRGAYRRGPATERGPRMFPPPDVDAESAAVSEPHSFVDSSLRPDGVAALREQLAALSDRERLVVRKYLVDGMLAYEIAVELGITESRVCQIVKAIRAKLGDAQ